MQFRKIDDGTDVMQVQRNYKALQNINSTDVETLGKVIENSIMFTLSKSGKYSKI